ncbi:hypothetical protein B4U80_13567 [Leptotrombidium deliense]|uniref:RRM domain-containing protein n=1 Tax=Leptotrombidium deliense TaxID=299467 RepID=A0A443S490_9ACAR|nr:hypothetical protein B4U80_13567 [Leptotrombidium deliense]
MSEESGTRKAKNIRFKKEPEASEDKGPPIRFSDNSPTKPFAINIFESTAVHIGNLHSESSFDDVYELFAKFGEIKNIKIYECSKSTKRYAFVYYENKVAAEKARSEMHFKRDTLLTFKESPLFVTFADTQRKNAKWYIRTAVSCGECFYWRVYGKCKELESKQCRFAHHDCCDRADQDKFIKKTINFEGYEQKDPKDTQYSLPKKNFTFLQDWYQQELRLRYKHLLRDILKIEWQTDDSYQNFADKQNTSEADWSEWDTVAKPKEEESVFITTVRKQEPITDWPVFKKHLF